MGQSIEITAMEDGAYGVRVSEGDATTSHRVRVPDAMLADLGLGGSDPQAVVRESFEFLLEREPATSILGDFALDRIADYFPEYFDELRARLS
ncbi:MAG: hypothetical protein WD770_10890 [Actinomycetota bacterium]